MPTDPIGFGPPIVELFQCEFHAENEIRQALDSLGRAVFDGGVDEQVIEALRRDSELAFAWPWGGGSPLRLACLSVEGKDGLWHLPEGHAGSSDRTIRCGDSGGCSRGGNARRSTLA